MKPPEIRDLDEAVRICPLGAEIYLTKCPRGPVKQHEDRQRALNNITILLRLPHPQHVMNLSRYGSNSHQQCQRPKYSS
jgi:hypothetical protein